MALPWYPGSAAQVCAAQARPVYRYLRDGRLPRLIGLVLFTLAVFVDWGYWQITEER